MTQSWLRLVVILAFVSSCAPPEAAGIDPGERQTIEANTSVNTHVSHDTVLLFALSTLRSGDRDGFERAIEEALDRNIVNLSLFLFAEGDQKVDLSDNTRKNLLCHLHFARAYRREHPFDTEWAAIGNAAANFLGRLPPLPDDIAFCDSLLPPLGEKMPGTPPLP